MFQHKRSSGGFGISAGCIFSDVAYNLGTKIQFCTFPGSGADERNISSLEHGVKSLVRTNKTGLLRWKMNIQKSQRTAGLKSSRHVQARLTRNVNCFSYPYTFGDHEV